MVVVAGILGIELPIPPDPLAIVAEYPDRPVEEAAQLRQDRRAEVVFERLGIVGQGAEDRAVDDADPQRAQPMPAHLKARVEAAFAPDAAAERDRCQRAVEPIAPL